MGQDEDSLISEGKKTQEKHQVMQRQSLTTSHQQSDVQLVSEQWLHWKNSTLLSFIVEPDIIWYTIHTPWSVCVSCVPSQHLASAPAYLLGVSE